MENNREIPEDTANWKANTAPAGEHEDSSLELPPTEPTIIDGEIIMYGGIEYPIKSGEWIFGTKEVWYKPE